MDACSSNHSATSAVYRVWIARFDDWRPTRWNEAPPRAEAIEPAIAGCLTRDEAAQFVAGFNEASLAEGAKLWAVVAPVALRYDGDFWPGAAIAPAAFPPDAAAAGSGDF